MVERKRAIRVREKIRQQKKGEQDAVAKGKNPYFLKQSAVKQVKTWAWECIVGSVTCLIYFVGLRANRLRWRIGIPSSNSKASLRNSSKRSESATLQKIIVGCPQGEFGRRRNHNFRRITQFCHRFPVVRFC